MTSGTTASSTGPPHPPGGPNQVFRALRGSRSPGEFAAAVRRAAREIGEQVSCDARYIGRVESGEIRCPNYAYERVFRHMFPGRDLTDLGFTSRDTVRGRRARHRDGPSLAGATASGTARGTVGHRSVSQDHTEPEESDVLRRAFIAGGPAAVAALSPLGAHAASADPPTRVGETEATSLEDTVRTIRLLDDRHGADGLYQKAGATLRAAYDLLDAGTARQSVSERLHSGAGELAISVGWLAHDSGRSADARSHYAEALATARMSGDTELEAHAFCNTAFLARDAGRPREAVRAAQAGQQAAAPHPSHRLRSLLALREAGGWAGLGDRGGCQEALTRARALFDRGPVPEDPAWMSFFGEAELAGLESQCWSALGEFRTAAACARRAVELQEPHFLRNTALFSAELAADLAGCGEPEEAAATGSRALALLEEVRSSRISAMLRDTARVLEPHRHQAEVAGFLAAATGRPA